MKVMMIKSGKGMANASGGATMTYEAGKEYEGSEAWQVKTFSYFVKNGFANEVGGNAAPSETKVARKPRAKKAE